MLCDVYLMKSKLSPLNTRLFNENNSKQEQEEYFNSLWENSGKVLLKCSYNGTRNLRISGNAEFFNYNSYNYCKLVYKLNDKEVKYYCFIDSYDYVNDRTSAINVTIDYIQTFLHDIKLTNCVVKQRTLPLNKKVSFDNSLYKARIIRYSNVYPYEQQEVKLLNSITQKTATGKNMFFVIVTVDKSFSQSKSVSSGIEFGQASFIFPFECSGNSYEEHLVGSGLTKSKSLNSFIANYGTYINNITIVDNSVGCINENFGLENGVIFTDTVNNTVYHYIMISNINHVEPFIFSYNIGLKQNLINDNYCQIMIKRIGSDGQLISLKDGDPNSFDIKLQNIYPNMIRLAPRNLYDKNIQYGLPPIISKVPYSVSAWSEYYATHSATVQDGLNTKHSYDMQMVKNNIIGEVAGNAMGIVAQAVSGKGISAIASVGQTLATSITAYENTKLGIEQENALLNIAWNDVKSSPNQTYNTESDDTTIILQDNEVPFTGIYAYTPLNIPVIERYHKRFGFEINMPIKDNATLYSYKDMFDSPKNCKGNQYDYIEYNGVVLYNENIPQESKRIIEKILEQGIYFWYTDDIGNFDVPNYDGDD